MPLLPRRRTRKGDDRALPLCRVCQVCAPCLPRRVAREGGVSACIHGKCARVRAEGHGIDDCIPAAGERCALIAVLFCSTARRAASNM
jgi:hypothetical protein